MSQTTAQPTPSPIPEGKPNPTAIGGLSFLSVFAMVWGLYEIRAWHLRSLNKFKKPGEEKKPGLSAFWFRDWG
jgi:hypothetical protein